MPALVEIQCPHCQATLKLKSRAPLGKKVQCPKCSQPFVAQERSGVAEVIDDYDDYAPAPAPAAPRPKRRPAPRQNIDDYDDFGDPAEFDDDFAPPRSSAGGRRKKKPVKKKKSSGGWVKWVLIGGGAVVGVAVLALGIWLGFRMFGSKKLDLAWLPEDASSISMTRYASLMNSELVKDGLSDADERAFSKMEDEWGFGIKDVESYTTASSGSETIRVLRTTVDLDPEKILKHAGDYEKTAYDGNDVYRYGGNLMYFPDKRTALSGPEASVKKAIDRGPKAKKRDDLAFADTRHDVVRIRLIKADNRFSGEILGIPLGKIVATCDGTSVSSSVKSTNQQKFASVEDAKEYYDKVQELQEKFRKQLDDENFLRNVPEDKREEAREFARSISFSFSRSGDTITTTVKMTPPKSLRNSTLGFLGLGHASKVKSAARNPGQFFGIFPNPFGNRNRFGNRIPVENPNRFGNRNRARRNIGRNRAGFNRAPRGSVKIYDITVNNYRGSRDQAFEAKVALQGVNGLDPMRTDVNANRITAYSRPNQTVNTGDIIKKLQQHGFGSVQVSQFRTE
jgi:predicted Zn finger-like uncharacterized protein